MLNELNGLVPIVVVGAIGLMMLVRGRRTRSAGSSAPPTARRRRPNSAAGDDEVAARDLSNEILRSQIDFHEFARELQARLDNKLSALQSLVVAADQRIAELERLRVDAVVQGTRPPGPHFAGGESSPRGELPSETTSRYAAIYALADAGHGPASIGARLGEPIGEVELVLSLRRRVPTNS